VCNGADGATNAWSLIGNAGTNPTTNFIGTTDAKDFVLKTNNIERMRVTSTGNIGVGVNNPLYKLSIMDVNVTTIPFGISDNSNFARFTIDYEGDSTTAYTNIRLDPKTKTTTDPAQFRFFRTTNTTGSKSLVLMRGNMTTQVSSELGVDGANSYFQMHGGNFGIGIVSPLGKFHINNDISGSDSSFVVKGDGKVGIGTSSPSVKLDVYGDIFANEASYKIFGPTSVTSYPLSAQGLLYGSRAVGTTYPFNTTGNIIIQSTTSLERDILFVTGTSPKERMVVKSDGNIGIGTTTPTDKLMVSSNDGLSLGFKVVENVNYAEIQTNKSGGSNLILQKTSGYVGIGLTSPVSTLGIRDDASVYPAFGIYDNLNNPRFMIDYESNGTSPITNIQFNPLTLSDTAQAAIRFFRTTNTTGKKFVVFLRGNSSTEESARISGDDSLAADLSAEESARLSADASIAADLSTEIESLADTDELTIELNTANNKIQLKDTVAAPAGGLRTFEGDIEVDGILTVGGVDVMAEISNEISRAEAAEDSIATELSTQVSYLISNIDVTEIDSFSEIVENLSNEVSRAESAELSLTNAFKNIFFKKAAVTGLINGENAVFTLGSAVRVGSEAIYLNGLLQVTGDDYTIDGTTLTFVAAPEAGDKVAVYGMY
jgi:hypothetical protein